MDFNNDSRASTRNEVLNDINISSLDVRIWGPQAWDFMHAVTFSYPVENPTNTEKKNIQNFFASIGTILPCIMCRTHFENMLKKYPPNVTSRDTLSRWLVDRHNDVNIRLGKPTMPFEFVKKKFEGMNNVCPVPSPNEDNCQCKSSDENCSYNQLKFAMAITLGIIGVLFLIAISIFLLFLFFKKK